MRVAISAELDGENLPVARGVLERHLAGCDACRGFRLAAVRLNRRVRVTPAPPVPDLTSQILAATEPPAVVATPSGGLRLGVALIGLLQLGLFLPALILGNDAGLPVHQARHLGSFGVALAVGLLVAAWRPHRISGLLPLAAALVVCLVASAIVDVATGHAAPSGELSHAVEVLGLLGLWLLARTPGTPVLELRAA